MGYNDLDHRHYLEMQRVGLMGIVSQPKQLSSIPTGLFNLNTRTGTTRVSDIEAQYEFEEFLRRIPLGDIDKQKETVRVAGHGYTFEHLKKQFKLEKQWRHPQIQLIQKQIEDEPTQGWAVEDVESGLLIEYIAGEWMYQYFENIKKEPKWKNWIRHTLKL